MFLTTNKVHIEVIRNAVWDGIKEYTIGEYEVIPLYWNTPIKKYRYLANAIKFCKKNGLEIVEDNNYDYFK